MHTSCVNKYWQKNELDHKSVLLKAKVWKIKLEGQGRRFEQVFILNPEDSQLVTRENSKEKFVFHGSGLSDGLCCGSLFS